MNWFHFDGIWTQGGWLDAAYLCCDREGTIQKIQTERPNASVEIVRGYAIPGWINAHSHAFQFAMAGTAEHLPAGAQGDNFWSWREAMYSLALKMSPETVEAVAAMLYAEMARVGYTHVVEFHYLHHDKNGQKYNHLAEMGERLIAAAQTAGINITLIPIFYQMGGFEQLASSRQRRFLSASFEEYANLWLASESLVKQHSHATIGVGVHSLRAVKTEDILRTFQDIAPKAPRHIHVAEQPKEVEDCLSTLGCRPVQWLLENIALDKRYHLVHATHTTEEELRGLAKSGAHVVLCPTTEGNLGDGRFDLVPFRSFGGRWSIGTDSHISLYPNEELRLLDYEQRIARNQRNILCVEEGDDSGTLAYQEALAGGLQSVGQEKTPTYFSVGRPFDAIVYNSNCPQLSVATKQHRMSSIVYSLDASATLGTIVHGNWIVQNQQHVRHNDIVPPFVASLQKEAHHP